MYSTFNELLDSWILGIIGFGGMLSSGAYLATNPEEAIMFISFLFFSAIFLTWTDHQYNITGNEGA